MRNTRQLNFAKQLRRHQTDAEQKLWYLLRGHRFLDLKFKRQKPIGPYIVDFVCIEHRLIIELDGGQHVEQALRDEARTGFLQAEGYRVLRFWNDEVLTQTESVLEQIRLNVSEKLPSPLPLSRKRERESLD